ncbi:MAG: ATP-binding cassette domain-containing protein [Candidatus Latescibacteria bacterium]|nr:ATP-binding cassette domain-containing protein [Candidatus Latescibacterota bacterium]
MTASAVRFSGVEKTYPHFKLAGLDFDLPQGQIMGFIGPNGAGKSTTMRILMGLIHQDRGQVEVLGRPMPAEQVAAKWDIGFVSEDMSLYSRQTLAWHMEFLQGIFPAWDPDYAQRLTRRFGLQPQQKIKEFSHGQKVKAALLLALARRPRLLVLDEPTTGLDPVARHEVLDELMEVLADEERSIFFSSQNTHDIEQLSDSIAFIDRGRIIDLADKETYLDRWRRLRLEVPQQIDLPPVDDIVDVRHQGRLAVVTTDRFAPTMANTYQTAGATVQKIEPMTLEEIFVANVQRSRGGQDNE